jgi:hypothetical protein
LERHDSALSLERKIVFGVTLDAQHRRGHATRESLETNMNYKHFLTTALFLGSIAVSTAAQAKPWVQLGCRDVDLGVDRDVIPVGNREGRFNAIRIRTAGNAVEMFNVKVVYGNGNPDDIEVRAKIAEGKSTKALDLRGRDRAIDKIELVYARVPNFKGRARLCVDGLTS